MSDPKEELLNGEPPTRAKVIDRVIKVSVEGGKTEINRITAERDELKRVLQDLAEKELEEKKDEVKRLIPETEHETIDEMGGFELNGFITGLEKSRGKKISSGIVRLRELGNDPEEFDESPEGRKRWALKLLEIKRDPNHPLHQQVKTLSRQARSDKDLLNYLPKTIDFSEALDPSLASGDLPYNYTFKQKAEWDREQAERKARNAK